MNPGDRALLRRVAQRDRAAMDDFFRALQEKVYRFACAQIGDAFAAAQVLDEVMLHVWCNASRIATADEPLEEILATTHALASEVGPAATSVEAVAAGHDVRLNQRLGTLPGAVRAALHLALAEDWSSARVARVMNCEEATVREHLRAATALIRDPGDSTAGALP